MKKNRLHGFTLIEMLVVIAIVAILAAIAVPNLQSYIRSSNVSSQTNEIVGAVALARSEAVRQNRPVTFCRSDAPSAVPACTASATGAWGGWIVWYTDPTTGVNTTVRLSSVTNATLQILSSSNVANAANTIVFRGDGLARDATGNLLNSGQIRVCVATSSANNARDIALRMGGKTVLTSSTSATCAAPGN